MSGQDFVLVTTAMKDSCEWHQNEVLTIDSVESVGVGSVVYLTSAVTQRHIAIEACQTKFGLLSCMITIQGSSMDSDPTDPDPLTCTYTNRNIFGSTSRPCPHKELTRSWGAYHGDAGGCWESRSCITLPHGSDQCSWTLSIAFSFARRLSAMLL
jgi:hypothetical protein